MKILQKGFTIIELIVVIAIISVLAAIVTSSTVGYINRAKDTSVKANIAQASKGLASYYADHGTFDGYVMPVALASSNYGYNANSSTGAFVVYGKIISSKYFAMDSTGKTGELTNPPGSTVYTVTEGSGTGSSCQGTSSVCNGLGSDDTCGPPSTGCCSYYSECSWQ